MPTKKRPAHRPRKYARGVSVVNIKVPLTRDEHSRVLTLSPEQRAAALLNLADQVEQAKKGQP